MNECGGILAYISEPGQQSGEQKVKNTLDGVTFGKQFADLLRKSPYYQCGVAMKNTTNNEVNTAKFMSRGQLHQEQEETKE